VTLNGVPLPTDGSTVALDLAFDAGCNAPLQVDYADAGEIGLVFTHVGSGATGGLTVTGADNLVFYPAALSISATNALGANLDATAATAAPAHVAAENFVLTISALNAAGVVTRGYRPQAVDRLLVYAERTGPTAGLEGVIRVSPGGSIPTRLNPPSGPGDYVPANVSAADFVNGVFTNAAAYYTEVGLVSLYAMDLDYMGHTISASPLDIGRFVPARFELDAGATVSNRVTTAGCSGSTFTYMDEQLSLSVPLKVVNALGAVTRNYRDSFASFAGSGFSSYAGVPGNTLGARSGSTALSDRLSLAGSGLSVPWNDGLATFEVFLSVSPATSPDGPYDATEYGLAFRDADGVALQNPDLDVDGDAANDHVRLGASRIRAGRVSIGNAHGSELQALSVPVVVQYFAGSGLGFMTHTLDSCTRLASAQLSDVDAGDALVVADTCIVDEIAASGANACPSGTTGIQYRGTALAGEYVVSLKAPGATKVGAMRVTADAPAWAEFDWTGAGATDPAGIATFGIYNRETELIYQREIR
jgi:MSHA biogenesis protein MshQ